MRLDKKLRVSFPTIFHNPNIISEYCGSDGIINGLIMRQSRG